jgi:hypothetical protein
MNMDINMIPDMDMATLHPGILLLRSHPLPPLPPNTAIDRQDVNIIPPRHTQPPPWVSSSPSADRTPPVPGRKSANRHEPRSAIGICRVHFAGCRVCQGQGEGARGREQGSRVKTHLFESRGVLVVVIRYCMERMELSISYSHNWTYMITTNWFFWERDPPATDGDRFHVSVARRT